MDYETIQRKAMILVRNEVNQCMSYAHEEMMELSSYQKVVWQALEAIDKDQDDEIYEIWIVSAWLHRQLDIRGEIVWEWNDVYFWGRMCTGQAIYMDRIIEEVVASLERSTTSEVSQSMLGSL